jgi:hypothetical protein
MGRWKALISPQLLGAMPRLYSSLAPRISQINSHVFTDDDCTPSSLRELGLLIGSLQGVRAVGFCVVRPAGITLKPASKPNPHPH